MKRSKLIKINIFHIATIYILIYNLDKIYINLFKNNVSKRKKPEFKKTLTTFLI